MAARRTPSQKPSLETVKQLVSTFPMGKAVNVGDRNAPVWRVAVLTPIAKGLTEGDIVLIEMSHGRFAFKTIVKMEEERNGQRIFETKDILLTEKK